MLKSLKCSMLAVAVLVLAAGCGGAPNDGPPRIAVSGTVTVDGTVVSHGSVFFSPRGPGKGANAKIVDGAFEVPSNGAVAGVQSATVTIFTGPPDDDGVSEIQGVAVVEVTIPADGTSDLTIALAADDVKPDENAE